MIDVDKFTSSPDTIPVGTTPVTLSLTECSATDDSTNVELVYSLAKDRNLFWSKTTQGTIDVSRKNFTVSARFNILPNTLSHDVDIEIGDGFISGNRFRITMNAQEVGGVDITRFSLITIQ